MTNAVRVIVLDDGNRGNFNQALGIAERLPEATIETITVPPPSLFHRFVLIFSANFVDSLPPAILRFLLKRFGQIDCPRQISREGVEKEHPGPIAIISAGSKLAPINLILSRYFPAKSIHVLYPDLIRLRLFDLLVTLEPDLWRHPWIAGAKNLMFIKGAPNRIKPEGPNSMSFPRIVSGNLIRIAVLIGGDDKNYRISEEWAEELSQRLAEISEKLPARIYLTTSRRTNLKVENIFRKFLGGEPERFNIVLYWQSFANPVAEFLAAADLIITTEDSINMVSESASSGKPAVALRVERKNKKRLVFDQALENLVAENYIRLWSLQDLVSSNVTEVICNPNRKVLAETEKVAAKVLELLGNDCGIVQVGS
ncbi:MAG: ELM1/GtrOC1 family putative glycosyltransferase [Candidatus Omnitrophota bacterium]|nr:mitochondrial fission ELM1 family protein [Candidatus Omnitrophota bacterium]